MAKKFGKFLLVTAAVGTAAAAAYYFINKKGSEQAMFQDEDEDYDDFCEDLEDDSETSSRNYVPLNREEPNTSENASTEAKPDNDKVFTPLAEQIITSTEEKMEDLEETIEEFFDEDDSTDEEPPISDM